MTKHKEKKCKCKWPNGAMLKGITERGGWLCSKCGEEMKEPIKFPTEPASIKVGKFLVNPTEEEITEAKTNNWS